VHLIDLVTGPFRADLGGDRFGKIIIRRSVTHERTQIEFACGKQTMSEHSIGGEPNAIA
jgi:hypothetical protein